MGNGSAPLVTFVVPCYNSAAFMGRAVESLLSAGDDCEILLVNDGSTDATGDIARAYAKRFERIRAIDQENANWGGVVNTALAQARGAYFKVLDSDDYFEAGALQKAVAALAASAELGTPPDLLITNYVYDHLASNSQRVMQYRSFFPQERVFEWGEMDTPGLDKFIMIHAAWYRTDVLRASGVRLEEGVSYMDSMLLLHPMPYVKKLLYVDVAPYHYIIGREGQSVEIDVVKKHIDEQLLASRLAIDDADYTGLFKSQPNCAMLMSGYVSCMMSTSTVHLFMIGTPDALAKNAELWGYLRQRNPALYEKVKHSWAGWANRKTAVGRALARLGYNVGRIVYKFS